MPSKSSPLAHPLWQLLVYCQMVQSISFFIKLNVSFEYIVISISGFSPCHWSCWESNWILVKTKTCNHLQSDKNSNMHAEIQRWWHCEIFPL
jgi:hypothetical protein